MQHREGTVDAPLQDLTRNLRNVFRHRQIDLKHRVGKQMAGVILVGSTVEARVSKDFGSNLEVAHSSRAKLCRPTHSLL